MNVADMVERQPWLDEQPVPGRAAIARRRNDAHRKRVRMSDAIVVGAGPNGLACAATLATRGVGVTVIEAAATIGGGARTSELTLPGLLHDDCSATHPIALGSAGADRARPRAARARVGLARGRPRPPASTTAAPRRCCARSRRPRPGSAPPGRAWKRLFGRLLGALRRASARTSCGRWRTCRATRSRLARFGLRGGGAGLAARPRPAHPAGAGAVRRHRRPRLQPLLAPVQLGRRHGADLRLPPLRLAGRPRRLAGDRRRARRRRARARRPDRDRPAGALAGGAAGCRRRDPRPRARRRRRDRRRAAAARASRAPTAATGTAPAPSRSTSRSRAACPGRTSVAAGRAPCTRSAPSRRSSTPSARSTAAACPSGPSSSSASSTSPTPRARAATCTRSGPTPTSRTATTGDATEALLDQIERFAPGLRERIVARHVRSPAELAAYNPNYVGGDILTGANTPLQIAVPAPPRPRPLRDRHPRRLHLLGRDPARRRRPRHERLQRGALGAALAAPLRLRSRGASRCRLLPCSNTSKVDSA